MKECKNCDFFENIDLSCRLSKYFPNDIKECPLVINKFAKTNISDFCVFCECLDVAINGKRVDLTCDVNNCEFNRGL